MIDNKFKKILKIISVKLSGINYAFIGTINLYIFGLDVLPRDIDILTDKKSIYEIEKRLKKFQTKPIYFDETEGRNSYRTFFKIDDVEIEVLGNVNNLCRPLDSLNKKVEKKIDDFVVYLVPLEEELETYNKMNRVDKVKLIADFLSKRK